MSLLTLTVFIDGAQATVRGPDFDDILKPGRRLAITVYQEQGKDVWYWGEYQYDANQRIHQWISDAFHFVGVLDGMRVQVEVAA